MSLISKIQSLISSANAVTGESRTDLTSAVQDLKDGYGGSSYDYLVSYETHDVTIDASLATGDQYLPYLVTPYKTSDPSLYQIWAGVASNNQETVGTQIFKGIVGGDFLGNNPQGTRGAAGTSTSDSVRAFISSYGMVCSAGTTVHLAIYTFKRFPNQ